MNMKEKLNRLYEKKNEMIHVIELHTRSLNEFKGITYFINDEEYGEFCTLIERKEETLRILNDRLDNIQYYIDITELRYAL